MSEQRISDSALRERINTLGSIQIDTGITFTHLSELNACLDLRDARAALRLREQGGAYDHVKANDAAFRKYPATSSKAMDQRFAFREGAQWQSEQPAPSPAGKPPEGGKIPHWSETCLPEEKSKAAALPTYRERLRDEFALAFAASGHGVEEGYRRADSVMIQRDKAGAQ